MVAYNEIHNVGDELVLWAPSHPGAVGDIKKHNGEVVRISDSETVLNEPLLPVDGFDPVEEIPF